VSNELVAITTNIQHSDPTTTMYKTMKDDFLLTFLFLKVY